MKWLLFGYLKFINDHGHACEYENLHSYGNVNSFRTVHSTHQSYLQATLKLLKQIRHHLFFCITHFIAIFKIIGSDPCIKRAVANNIAALT